MKRIYLDHNATTPLDPRVLDAMLPFLKGSYGNPSSLHGEGREARRAVEDARDSVAALLQVDPRDVVFCSGATEANNWALRWLGSLPRQPRRLLVSAVEHPSVLEAAESQRRDGVVVERVGVDGTGVLSLAALEASLAQPCSGVAIMAVNNEVGSIQPIAPAWDLCSARGVPLHVDAVQAPGKLDYSPGALPATTLSISAHKIGGPKGAGALVLRNGARIPPLFVGGGQERERRAGTENVAAIVGFGAAARLAALEGAEWRTNLAGLERAFLDRLTSRSVAFVRNGPDATARVPGTLNLRCGGRTGEGLLLALDLAGVAVSLGSACSSGAARPSHVLAAMGLSKVDNLGSVRISFGCRQTVADSIEAADRFAAVFSGGPSVAGPG